MTPVTPEPRVNYSAIVFARNQPQYRSLPANSSDDTLGHVETKWKLDWRERLQALLFGTLYLTVRTYHAPLQPIRMSLTRDN